MAAVRFSAPEYRADGSFARIEYEYTGDENNGWTVRRNGETALELGPGYRLLRTQYCGVCSTDIARAFLPYPLPQIIGHEVVARDEADRAVVVEINASHLARGLHETDCPFCARGLGSQCPARITLGIDRLPGGFAPYLLAPTEAIIEIPAPLNPLAAALTEPFAAALHGVERSEPRGGESVAVLGPRRLGMLALAALAGLRRANRADFEIVALLRHDSLAPLARAVGADRVVNLRATDPAALRASFDLVFDTTGKPEGLALALELARRRVHLKSTHGQNVFGLERMADLVVDELSIYRFCPTAGDFTWPGEGPERANANIFVAPAVPQAVCEKLRAYREKTGRTPPQFHRLTYGEAFERIEQAASSAELARRLLPGSPFPRFDLALVSRPEEIDTVIRPVSGREISLVRPRGALLYSPPEAGGGAEDFAPLGAALERGVGLDSSRCGDFARALEILAGTPDIARTLETEMITHRFALDDIEDAFRTAADSRASVKVIVNTGAQLPDTGISPVSRS